MRWAILLFLALQLVGCMKDQERQLATCKLESMRLYQEPQFADPFATLPYNKYIVTCMASKGYAMVVSDNKCVIGVNFVTQVECYKPTGWFERAVFDWLNSN
jgi:hypothetical protein